MARSGAVRTLNLLLLLHFKMPENIPHAPVPRRDFNAFQIPCGHAGCKRFFKTAAGRTKHILSAHPIVSSPPPEEQYGASDYTDMDPSSPQDDATNPLSPGQMDHHDCNSDSEESRSSSPTPDGINAEFFGPGDLLYRNYHALLNGYLFWFQVFNFIFLLHILSRSPM